MGVLAPRMLLIGALALSGSALAFLIGARAGFTLDRVVTSTHESTPSLQTNLGATTMRAR